MEILVLTYGYEKWASNRVQGSQSCFEDIMATKYFRYGFLLSGKRSNIYFADD